MAKEQETQPTGLPTLDVAGHYPWRVVLDAQGKPQLELDLSVTTTPYFVGHLQELATLDYNGKPLKPQETLEQAQKGRKLHFAVPELKAGETLTLRMNNQPISALQMAANGSVQAAPKHHEYQLAISETRALGRPLRRGDDETRNVLNKLPYDRAARAGFDPKKHAPITDVHTHSSAQISGKDLIQAAIDEDLKGKEPLCYPIELLELLRVYPDAQKQTATPMKGRGFNPMKDEGLKSEQEGADCKGIRASELTERQKAALIAKMDIPADATMSFSDFDREMYRYRNPFVKHPALTKQILIKIAEDYQRQGVKYAELSTGSMMDPKWFEEMAEVVKEIEDKGGPKLRFLIGVPRNASPQQTFVMLEKIKYLSRHPYIVGVDLLGYESNKTSEFNWALSHLAQWAKVSTGTELKTSDGWDFKRDFIIRVHAGETEKNEDNVRDAVNLAAKHGVRLRIGHGLHAKMDATSDKHLAQITAQAGNKGLDNPDQFATERCMDSNQVYRTKLFVHNQPPFLEVHQTGTYGTKVNSTLAPRFLGTDGGGAIGTGPVQLAYSALASGMTLKELGEIHQFEEGYVARQGQREAIKTGAFNKLYPGGLKDFLSGYQKEVDKIPKGDKALLTYLPEPFQNKTPILIGGASGSSWDKMGKEDRMNVARAMQFLVRTCDPKKTYFVLGRVQDAGVSKALDVAVMQWNAEHPENQFAVLGRFAGAGKAPTADLADSITWVQDIPQGREYVPSSMVGFIQQHQGVGIFFNGSDFTAEMAYNAADRRVPHAVHDPIQRGHKMSEVAENTEAPTFQTFDDFINKVVHPTGKGHLFADESIKKTFLRDGVNLDAMRDEAMKAAATTAYPKSEPATPAKGFTKS